MSNSPEKKDFIENVESKFIDTLPGSDEIKSLLPEISLNDSFDSDLESVFESFLKDTDVQSHFQHLKDEWKPIETSDIENELKKWNIPSDLRTTFNRDVIKKYIEESIKIKVEKEHEIKTILGIVVEQKEQLADEISSEARALLSEDSLQKIISSEKKEDNNKKIQPESIEYEKQSVDYFQNFLLKNMQSYSWDVNSFKEKNTSFIKKNQDKKNKINSSIASEYILLIQALEKGKYFDNDREKKEANIYKEFTDVVNKSFEQSWKNGTDLNFVGLANYVYSKKTWGAKISWSSLDVSKKSHIVITDSSIAATDVNNKFMDVLKTDKEKQTFSNTAKKAMSKDLLNFLHGIDDPNLFQKLLLKKRPSKDDKKAVERFVNTADKISFKQGADVSVSQEKRLLDYMYHHINQIWTYTVDNWKDVLTSLELDADNGVLKDLVKVSQDYQRAYQMEWQDQLPLYRTIIDAISTYGSIERTYIAYYQDIEEYKKGDYLSASKWEKKLKKEDQIFYAFAKSLNVPMNDAYRLSQLDQKYFENKKPEQILADFNFDGKLTYADNGWIKVGLQFLDLYDRLSEWQKIQALDSLLNVAKNINKNLPSGEKLEESTITMDSLTKGNKNVILLVQSVIRTPGFSLSYLMNFGSEGLEQYEKVHSVVAESDKAAKEIVNSDETKQQLDTAKKQMKAAGIEYDQSVTPEGLQQAISSALAEAYQSGVGIGTGIKFDQWVKGLSLNFGFNVWDVVEWSNPKIGITLAYNKHFEGKNGRGASVWGSGWAVFGFVPVFSLWAEVTKDFVDKKLATSNSIRSSNRLWIGANFTLVSGVPVWWGKIGWNRDKSEGIEKKYENLSFQMKSFSEALITKLLESPDEKTQRDVVTDFVKEKWKDSRSEDIENAVNNLLKLLAYYPTDTLKNNPSLQRIATEHIAEAYTESWRNSSLSSIDRQTYFGGASLWIQFIAGVMPIVTIGGVFKQHRLDGSKESYQSKLERTKALMNGEGNFTKEEFSNKSRLDQAILDDINVGLRLSGDKKIVIENGFVKIPAVLYSSLDSSSDVTIALDPAMKGLIKKDEYGNILLSPKTPIRFLSHSGGQFTQQVLNIGSDIFRSDAVSLNKVNDISDWFTNGNIDEKSLPQFDTKINRLDQGSLDALVNQLKERNPDDKSLENLSLKLSDDGKSLLVSKLDLSKLAGFSDSYSWGLDSFLQDKFKLDLWSSTSNQSPFKSVDSFLNLPMRTETLSLENKKLVITKLWENYFDYSVAPRDEKEPFSIHYIDKSQESKQQVMFESSSKIASDIYTLARKVKTNALSNISHVNKLSQSTKISSTLRSLGNQYTGFAEAMKNGEYEKAKEMLPVFLPAMDIYINKYQKDKVNFSALNDSIKDLTWNELAQTLMSFNNIFARVQKVTPSADGEGYDLKKYVEGKYQSESFANVIGEREGQIARGLERTVKDDNIRNAYKNLLTAGTKYGKTLNIQSTFWTEVLPSAIALNLGNSINPENPLLNPEIVKGSLVDISSLELDAKDVYQLKQRAVDAFVNTDALIQPLLDKLTPPLYLDDALRTQLKELLMDSSWLKKTLDIDWKKYILTADAVAKFAYFVQCVNHMLVLDDINITLTPEGKMNENVVTMWGSAVYKRNTGDGMISHNVSTMSVELAVSARIPENKKKEKFIDNEGESDPNDGSGSNEGWSNPEDGSNPETPNMPDNNTPNNINEWGGVTPVDPDDVPDSF